MAGRTKSNRNQILRDLILQFPKIPKAAIARKAVDLYPLLFDDVESAR